LAQRSSPSGVSTVPRPLGAARTAPRVAGSAEMSNSGSCPWRTRPVGTVASGTSSTWPKMISLRSEYWRPRWTRNRLARSVKPAPVRGSTPAAANSSNSAISWSRAWSTRSLTLVSRVCHTTRFTSVSTAAMSRTTHAMIRTLAGIRNRRPSSGGSVVIVVPVVVPVVVLPVIVVIVVVIVTVVPVVIVVGDGGRRVHHVVLGRIGSGGRRRIGRAGEVLGGLSHDDLPRPSGRRVVGRP